jgi:hypothetical protein
VQKLSILCQRFPTWTNINGKPGDFWRKDDIIVIGVGVFKARLRQLSHGDLAILEKQERMLVITRRKEAGKRVFICC